MFSKITEHAKFAVKTIPMKKRQSALRICSLNMGSSLDAKTSCRGSDWELWIQHCTFLLIMKFTKRQNPNPKCTQHLNHFSSLHALYLHSHNLCAGPDLLNSIYISARALVHLCMYILITSQTAQRSNKFIIFQKRQQILSSLSWSLT